MHVIVYQHLNDDHSIEVQARLYHTLEPAARQAKYLASRNRLILFSIDHPPEDHITLDEVAHFSGASIGGRARNDYRGAR
jgi:hypothetical protein